MPMLFAVAVVAALFSLVIMLTVDHVVAVRAKKRHQKAFARMLVARIIREREWAESCRRVWRSPTPCRVAK